MAQVLLYKPAPKWQLCTAFAAAVFVHLGVIALGQMHGDQSPPTLASDPPVIEVTDGPAIEPLADPIELPPLPPPPPLENPAFVEDNPTPQPVRRVTQRAAQPIARPATPGVIRSSAMNSAKVFALSAPRPDYPYEARRQRATGSGVAVLTVDSATGNVVEVVMSTSTGNTILDASTTSTFRRWRFKPGTVRTVQTPITFTLTGANY